MATQRRPLDSLRLGGHLGWHLGRQVVEGQPALAADMPTGQPRVLPLSPVLT